MNVVIENLNPYRICKNMTVEFVMEENVKKKCKIYHTLENIKCDKCGMDELCNDCYSFGKCCEKNNDEKKIIEKF